MAENAQKSEVHATTDDASTSPASDAEAKRRPDRIASADISSEIGGGPGAADASSGGGAGAGIPGGGTDTRLGDNAPKPGNPDEDREKLFPKGTHVKRDESDYGGPIDVDVDTNE